MALRHWIHLPSALLLGTLSFSPGQARAQGPSDAPPGHEQAIDLYGKGRDTLALGKPAEALPLLEESYALLKSPNTELLMAHANRDLGRKVKALELYARAEKNAREEIGKGQSRYAETAEEARRATDVLLKDVGTLDVKAPAGARIEVFRGPGDVAVLTGPGRVWVEPGPVRVVVTAGSNTQDKSVTAVAGAVTDITFVASTLVTVSDEGGSRFGALAIAGGVVGGVGLVGLGLFAGFGTSAQSIYARLEDCNDACDEDLTAPQAVVLREDGTRAQTIANVSLGAGLTLVAAGAVLIIIDALTPGAPAGVERAMTPVLSVSKDGFFGGFSLTL